MSSTSFVSRGLVEAGLLAACHYNTPQEVDRLIAFLDLVL